MAYDAMTATSPAAFLWFVAIIVMGNYILLNLFLAILLENFGSSSGNGGTSTANSTGGTLAAAAKAAQLAAWLQDLLEESWFAKMYRSRNRVAVLQDDEGSDELVAPRFSSAGGNKQVQPGKQVSAMAIQEAAGSSNDAAAATRGPAFLQGPTSSGDVGDKLVTLMGQRASMAGGYSMAALHRRYVPCTAARLLTTHHIFTLATLCFASPVCSERLVTAGSWLHMIFCCMLLMCTQILFTFGGAQQELRQP